MERLTDLVMVHDDGVALYLGLVHPELLVDVVDVAVPLGLLVLVACRVQHPRPELLELFDPLLAEPSCRSTEGLLLGRSRLLLTFSQSSDCAPGDIRPCRLE